MSESPTTEDLSFSDEFLATADRLVRRYPVARSALLPLLHLVQSEHGYVSEAGVAFCADRLALTKAEVGAVSTFYTMFKRTPVGDYLLSVCTNPPCQVAGAQTIYERYKQALDGDLTDLDTGVSIEEAECLGICDAAPVVQVNYEMYGPLTDEEADRLLDGCRKGQPPASSWSGEPAPTFAEVERELSGANDAFLDANIAASRRSVADHEVPPMRTTGETDIPVTMPGGDPGGHGGEVFAAAYGAADRAQDADRAAAAVADDELVDAQAASGADGSTLQVGEHHHPDAEADVDSSGATTDITDTSLPATGRDPADPGDATVADPGEARVTPDTVTDPTPGRPAADEPEESGGPLDDDHDLDDGAVSAASSTPTTASRADGTTEPDDTDASDDASDEEA